MQAHIFLFLSVAGAVETSFLDWLPDANNLEEYNPVEYITTQSSSSEDHILFTNENQALTFEDQIPFDLNPLDPTWDLFADTSGDCSDVLVPFSKSRYRKREGAFCAASQKKTRKSRLGIPTLQEIEAQEALRATGMAGAAGESSQTQCPPKDHPEAIEAVCSSGDPNDMGNSMVFAGALILANCERLTILTLPFCIGVKYPFCCARFTPLDSQFTYDITEQRGTGFQCYPLGVGL